MFKTKKGIIQHNKKKSHTANIRSATNERLLSNNCQKTANSSATSDSKPAIPFYFAYFPNLKIHKFLYCNSLPK